MAYIGRVNCNGEGEAVTQLIAHVLKWKYTLRIWSSYRDLNGHGIPGWLLCCAEAELTTNEETDHRFQQPRRLIKRNVFPGDGQALKIPTHRHDQASIVAD